MSDVIRARPRLKKRLRRLLHAVGYDTADWMRIVMYRQCFAFIRDLGPERLDVLEISGGPQWKREFDFRSYTTTSYPDFDVCSETLPERFDLIIADQVFEHLKWPYRAGKNVLTMLKPGGRFIVTVPFLVGFTRRLWTAPGGPKRGLATFCRNAGSTPPRSRPAPGGTARALWPISRLGASAASSDRFRTSRTCRCRLGLCRKDGRVRSVFINGRFLTQVLTGVQRYSRSWSAALELLVEEQPDPDTEWVLLCPAKAELPPLRAVRSVTVGGATGHLWEQRGWPPRRAAVSW